MVCVTMIVVTVRMLMQMRLSIVHKELVVIDGAAASLRVGNSVRIGCGAPIGHGVVTTFAVATAQRVHRRLALTTAETARRFDAAVAAVVQRPVSCQTVAVSRRRRGTRVRARSSWLGRWRLLHLTIVTIYNLGVIARGQGNVLQSRLYVLLVYSWLMMVMRRTSNSSLSLRTSCVF